MYNCNMTSDELHPQNKVSFTLSQHRETGNPLTISPTDIGTIVEHGQCPRYTKMQGDSRFSDILFKTKQEEEDEETEVDELDEEDQDGVAYLKGSMEILSKEGNEFEESIYSSLIDQLYVDEFYNLESVDGIGNETVTDPLVTNSPSTALQHLRDKAQSLEPEDDIVIYGQFPVQNFIGAFSVAGLADLVCLVPTDEGVEVIVFDVKASWDEKVSQQLQASTYTHILRDQLSDFDNISITAGIIHKENYEFITDCILVEDFQESYPRFSVLSREDDIERLLSESGMIYKNVTRDIDDPVYSSEEAFELLSEIPYQIDKHCENCKFRDACFKQALESLDISLLGISQGERDALREYNIKTLTDLADMVYNNGNFEFIIKDEYKDRVTNLQQNHGVQDVKEMAIKATQMYRKINPEEGSQLIRKNWTPQTLPQQDNWVEDRAIKVFLNVQYDYITNTVIQLNAHIVPGGVNEDTHGFRKEITQLIPEIPFDYEENRVDIEKTQQYEQELLENFTTELFSYIEKLSDDLFGGTGYLHFYTYGEYEQEVLTESTGRHKHSSKRVNALYELLGVRDRENGGQEMWSSLENEIEWGYYMDQLATSLPATFKDGAFMDWDQDDYLGTYKFTYNGDTYNLDNCFSEQFFNYNTAYQLDVSGDDVSLSLQDSSRFSTNSDDNMISNEAFSGANVPLEYYWGLPKYELESYLENRSEESEENIDSTLIPYLYESDHNNSTRLSEDHVSAMGIWIVRMLHQIERSIVEDANKTNKVREVNKASIQLDQISSFTSHSNTFADALLDYTQIEFVSKKNELLNEYEKTVEQRIKQGKSIPVQVNNIIGDDNSYGELEITCEFAYSEFAFEDMSFVKSSLKHEVGDYLNATHLEFTGGSANTKKYLHGNHKGNTYPAGPEDIINSPQVIVKELDQMKNKVVLTHKKNRFDNKTTLDERKFTLSQCSWGGEEELQEGDYLLLDEQLSTYHFDKDTESLGELENNILYHRVNDLLHGSEQHVSTSYDPTDITQFLQLLDDVAEQDSTVNYPNPEQENFIADTSPISLLQGPPGTGKTSGSLAPAILSRSESYEGYRFKGAVTGPSNKAIDEVMNKTYELAEALGLSNIEFTRILSSSHEPETRKDDIEYMETNAEFKTFVESLEQSSINSSNQIVFGTPTKIKQALTLGERDVNNTERFFDLVVVDEASMMTLPNFFTAGPFVKRSAQVLISGDQRQMAPVQTHEWTEETRPSIQKYVPYLSTLNYMLFLRGDEVDKIGFPEEHIEQPNAEIPLHQLERTYRCHATIAEFLQEWVYSQDNLNYRSNITDTIDINTEKDTEGVSTVLGDAPFVVVTHSDTQSQESNLVETNIMKSITDSLKRNSWSGTKGVVTPHSSQKGLVKSKDVAQETDTVERYQGGERDLIMVSSTVSDPSFIRKEDDFLLNPNRINVAISRMKKKLIIVVPDSVFEHIPDDIDVYDKSMIWNGLYDFVIDTENPDWEGSLQEFVGQSDGIRDDVNVKVHTR